MAHLISFDPEELARVDSPGMGDRLVSIGEIIKTSDGVAGRVIGFTPIEATALIEWAPEQMLGEHPLEEVNANIKSKKWARLYMPDLAFTGLEPVARGGRVVVVEATYGNDAGREGSILYGNEFNGQVHVHLHGQKKNQQQPYLQSSLRRSFLSPEILPVIQAEYQCTPVNARAAMISLLRGEKVENRVDIDFIPPVLKYVLQNAQGDERKHLSETLWYNETSETS